MRYDLEEFQRTVRIPTYQTIPPSDRDRNDLPLPDSHHTFAFEVTIRRTGQQPGDDLERPCGHCRWKIHQRNRRGCQPLSPLIPDLRGLLFLLLFLMATMTVTAPANMPTGKGSSAFGHNSHAGPTTDRTTSPGRHRGAGPKCTLLDEPPFQVLLQGSKNTPPVSTGYGAHAASGTRRCSAAPNRTPRCYPDQQSARAHTPAW